MKIVNLTRRIILVEHAKIASSFWRRLKGLLFTKSLPMGQGLILKKCKSIHTFGMTFTIDVIFVDSLNTVIKTAEGVKPGRISICSGSCFVIEVPEGTISLTGTKKGDKLGMLS